MFLSIAVGYVAGLITAFIIWFIQNQDYCYLKRGVFKDIHIKDFPNNKNSK